MTYLTNTERKQQKADYDKEYYKKNKERIADSNKKLRKQNNKKLL